MNENSETSQTNPIPINPALVWDYEIPSEENQTDAFRKWYLARVLARGNSTDLQTIGLGIIYMYLPGLNLPIEVRRFWEWYFNLPEVKARYASPDPVSTTDHRSHQ